MKRLALALLPALLLSATLMAESPGEGPDPFARYLFPPDRVMGHAQEIGLNETQRNAIRNEVQKVQHKFIDSQFDMQSEMEKMANLLQEKTVEETKVLAQLDRILTLERDIKKLQIGLLVRVRNLLTDAQQAKLAQLQTSSK
jgi:Spy/CpxP family protein refolding chaperone